MITRAQRAKLKTGMLRPKLRSRNITSREGRRRSESWQSRESGRPYRTSPCCIYKTPRQSWGFINTKIASNNIKDYWLKNNNKFW